MAVLKKGRFGYQWQVALALVGPISDTPVESTISAGTDYKHPEKWIQTDIFSKKCELVH